MRAAPPARACARGRDVRGRGRRHEALVELLEPRLSVPHLGRAVGVAACRSLEANLRRSERMLGPDAVELLGTRHQRGQWLLRLAERHEEAVIMLERLVVDTERSLGVVATAALSSRNDLALAYSYAGRTNEAIAIYEPLRADCERILGADDPLTLTARHNLSSALHAAGHPDEAIAIYESLIPDRERTLGLEHPNTLTSRNNLAGAYQDAGRLEEAIAAFEATRHRSRSDPRRRSPGLARYAQQPGGSVFPRGTPVRGAGALRGAARRQRAGPRRRSSSDGLTSGKPWRGPARWTRARGGPERVSAERAQTARPSTIGRHARIRQPSER